MEHLTNNRLKRSIRHATLTDLPAILKLIEEGRQKMRLEGNDEQWTDGNPREELFREDIQLGHSYLVEDDGRPVATFAFIPSPEPTYKHIYNGQWLDEAPYYVIHRMASSPDAHGIMMSVLDYTFSHTDNIRIDTHRKNATMQRLLQKFGFQYCGIIYLTDGAERLAYQRRITTPNATL